MSTNLLIGYPDIPSKATVFTEPATAPGYSSKAIVSGPRGTTWKGASAVTSITWEWDLGAGNERAPDYIYYARLDLIGRRNATTTTSLIYGSASSSFTSPNSKVVTYGNGSLQGPDGRDRISIPTAYSSTYRYWRCRINCTSQVPEISKIYFGTALDFGRDPRRCEKTRRRWSPQNRNPGYRYIIEWLGVSNANVQTFNEDIARYPENSIILFTRTYHDVLDDHQVIPFMIEDYQITADNVDSNTVRLVLDEVI